MGQLPHVRPGAGRSAGAVPGLAVPGGRHRAGRSRAGGAGGPLVRGGPGQGPVVGVRDMGEWEWVLTIGPRRKGGPGSGHHGHAGRPGKRGGSAPGKGQGKYGVGTDPEKGFGPGQETALFAEKWFTDDIPNRDWYGANKEVRSEVKARIIQELSDRTGIAAEDVNTFIKQWSHSSNDEDMRSLAIQADAAAEFGVKLSEFTKGNIDNLLDGRDKDAQYWRDNGFPEEQIRIMLKDRFPLMKSVDQRKLLRLCMTIPKSNWRVLDLKER